eukprot:TRINITY_DN8278_c0_g1_i1.p1 TRINITY_DN8278_c0_g1~~TRINITY_DN8278_c0_g1_i1.p1  ORF type:complete len:267 (+),score=43.33 TRINITY_DN8278_c0_g1_i1:24-803(+)
MYQDDHTIVLDDYENNEANRNFSYQNSTGSHHLGGSPSSHTAGFAGSPVSHRFAGSPGSGNFMGSPGSHHFAGSPGSHHFGSSMGQPFDSPGPQPYSQHHFAHSMAGQHPFGASTAGHQFGGSGNLIERSGRFGVKHWSVAAMDKHKKQDFEEETIFGKPGHASFSPGNIFWAIFFGWWLALVFLFVSAILHMTIVASAYGTLCYQLARYIVWPFGKFLVSAQSERDTGDDVSPSRMTEASNLVKLQSWKPVQPVCMRD